MAYRMCRPGWNCTLRLSMQPAQDASELQSECYRTRSGGAAVSRDPAACGCLSSRVLLGTLCLVHWPTALIAPACSLCAGLMKACSLKVVQLLLQSLQQPAVKRHWELFRL